MVLHLCPQLAPDLEAVEQRLEQETAKLMWPHLSPCERHFLPALVILSGRFYGYRDQRLLSLATVLQLIFIASFIHTNASREAARPTLWGDYLYTKFFDLLCRDGNLEFLKPLAEMICTLHLRFITSPEQKEVKEDNDTGTALIEVCGIMGGIAAQLGGILGGARPEEARVWYELGHALGILWGRRITGQGTPVLQHIRAVEVALGKLPDVSEREILKEMFLALIKPSLTQQLAT